MSRMMEGEEEETKTKYQILNTFLCSLLWRRKQKRDNENLNGNYK